VKLWQLGIALVGASLVASVGLGQSLVIAERADGTVISSAPSGSDIVINVGEIGGDTTVRLRDLQAISPGIPVASVGRVIVEGAVQTGTGAQLRLVVVNGAENLDGIQPLTPTGSGLVDFGTPTGSGLIIRNPNDPTDTSLRDSTVLTLAVTGNVYGPIDVGRVRRLQAFGITQPDGSIVGGNVLGDVTAHAPNTLTNINNVTSFFSNAIGVVTVGNRIDGTIRATGVDPTPDQPLSGDELAGSIGKIVVGPSTTGGIFGDILAERGRIGAVFSVGPIGSPSERIRIVAGNGIYQVRTSADSTNTVQVDQVSTEPVNASGIYADVIANAAFRVSNSVASPTFEAPILSIATLGDFVGDVRARNIASRTNAPHGIRIGGTFDGSIDVDYNLENADIIAARITGPVRVGWKCKGSIVAFDAQSGTLDSIDIGNKSDPDARYVRQYVPGFIGNDCGPLPAVRDASWLSPQSCYDIGTQDSVIFAQSARSIDIKAMTKYAYTADGSDGRLSKFFGPRIEVATVIENLKIDDLREGIVWSGVDETPLSESGNDFANDYTDVRGNIEIGCVGPAASIWATGFKKCDVKNTLSGWLRLPELAAEQTVTVGDGLQQQAACGCVIPLLGCTFLQTNAPSVGTDTPRASVELRTYGAVIVAKNGGLHGQVVLDAKNTTGLHRAEEMWAGVVQVGEPNQPFGTGPDQVRLSFKTDRASSPRSVAPIYQVLPSELGGGAVGLVPFAVHEASSDAINAGRNILTSTLGNASCDDVWAAVDFYGPVELELNPLAFPPSRTTLKVGSADLSNISSLVRHQRNGHVGAARRMLEVRGRSGAVLPPATDTVMMGLRYEASSDLTLSNPLRCDFDILTQEEGPFVKTFAYRFQVGFDREPDCVSDNPLAFGYQLPAAFCDSIDFNNNEVFPEDQDVLDFFNVLAGGDCSDGNICNDIDFNNNTVFPEDMDVIAFFNVLAGGPCMGS